MASPPAPSEDRESHRSSAREVATWVVRRLADAGFTAYFAGGCVRDQLMGNEPTDFDVATNARPEDIKSVFPRAHAVGESFGVLLIRRHGHTIETATFRTDGRYSDGRHPEEVHFSDAEHDARRRDFTVNGLFEDPLTGSIIDFVGGQADLESRTLRAIGNPHDRIHEDRLRMLRAVRFTARFGFSLEEATADAIRQHAENLKGVSRERIGQEVRRMLLDQNRAVAAWELQYLGLDETVLGEPNQTVAPTRLGQLPEPVEYATALAAWIFDRHGESVEADRAAKRWRRALMLSNDECDALKDALDYSRALRTSWPRLGVARQKRIASSPPFDQALRLVQTADRQEFIDIRRRVLDLEKTGLAPEPLLSGHDLIEAGMKPGPEFRRILDGVYDAQLEGQIHDPESAMELARLIRRTLAKGGGID